MTLFDRVFGGNDAVYGLTEGAIDGAIAQYGEDKAVSFPNTAYSLPCYYAVTGTKVTTLKELKEALGVVKTLMTREKRLNDAFMSGVATALCAEFIEVLKYIDGATPYEEPCYGHLGDAVIRELGVPLVTGDIPGVAVILGAAPTTEEGVALVKSYQAQGILVTLVGGIIDQVAEAGMKTGANVRVIPLGKDVTSVVHVVSVAIRAALIFGNVTPGDAGTLMKYTMDRVPAFVNAFKPLDDVIVACGAGAIALGFPVVTNETENIFRVPKSLIVQEDVSKFNATSLEARDIKIKITNIDIPVADAPAVTPSTGQYEQAMKITIQVPDGYTAYYTTDGTTPSESSNTYLEPFDMPEGKTVLQVVLINGQGKMSQITTRSYELDLGGDEEE